MKRISLLITVAALILASCGTYILVADNTIEQSTLSRVTEGRSLAVIHPLIHFADRVNLPTISINGSEPKYFVEFISEEIGTYGVIREHVLNRISLERNVIITQTAEALVKVLKGSVDFRYPWARSLSDTGFIANREVTAEIAPIGINYGFAGTAPQHFSKVEVFETEEEAKAAGFDLILTTEIYLQSMLVEVLKPVEQQQSPGMEYNAEPKPYYAKGTRFLLIDSSPEYTLKNAATDEKIDMKGADKFDFRINMNTKDYVVMLPKEADTFSDVESFLSDKNKIQVIMKPIADSFIPFGFTIRPYFLTKVRSEKVEE